MTSTTNVPSNFDRLGTSIDRLGDAIHHYRAEADRALILRDRWRWAALASMVALFLLVMVPAALTLVTR